MAKMSFSRIPKNHTGRLALIDGKIIKYDACQRIDSGIPKYSEKNYKYIGTGTIYSINGIKQSNNNNKYFFYLASRR